MQTRRWSLIARLSVLFLVLTSLPGVATRTAPLAQAAPAAQETTSPTLGLPGFGEPSSEVTVVTSASGPIDPPLADGATLSVERLSVDPGASLPEIDGAQILQVEQGTLSFEDDLGLEAEIDAGTSQFFAAGAATALANSGDSPAIVVRTSITGSTREVGSTQGGDATGTRPANDSGAGELAAVAQLSAQSDEAPTEVVVEYADDGFTPNELSLAQGGSLVIENTTSRPCAFAIDDLSITATIDPDEITPVVVDGPAGAHDFTCSAAEGGDPIATGTLHMVRVSSAPTPTPEPTDTPASTPQATPVTPASATPAVDGKSGTLVEKELADLPPGNQLLFSAQVVMNPGAILPLTGAAGPVALTATGGDITVAREGHPPSKLRDGRSVVVPTGTVADVRNDGDTPVTLQIAGVGTSSLGSENGGDATGTATNGSDSETDTRPGDSTPDSSADQPVDMTGANQFFPTDSEMENLGLFASGGSPQENSEPAQNAFWFTSSDEASTLLPEWDWQGSLLQQYASKADGTAYGAVDALLLNVDTFTNADGAANFMDFINTDVFADNAEHSDIVTALPGVDLVYNGTFYDSDKKVDIGFMVIQSGEYTITLYATGADLDATALLEDVATLILGARG
jgi:quercetin dioxygenase-like cupin family protein